MSLQCLDSFVKEPYFWGLFCKGALIFSYIWKLWCEVAISSRACNALYIGWQRLVGSQKLKVCVVTNLWVLCTIGLQRLVGSVKLKVYVVTNSCVQMHYGMTTTSRLPKVECPCSHESRESVRAMHKRLVGSLKLKVGEVINVANSCVQCTMQWQRIGGSLNL